MVSRRSSLPDEAAAVFPVTDSNHPSTRQNTGQSTVDQSRTQPWSMVNSKDGAIDWADSLSYSSSMLPPPRRSIADKCGILTLITVILTTITLLGTWAFLCWLWLISYRAI